jgi:hypothetical protein
VSRRALPALLPALLLLGWAGGAHAQSITPSNAGQYFRLESHSEKNKKGQDIVWGYVYNDRGKGYARIRLQIDTLDAAGQPIASQIGYVDDEVPLFNRAYYDIRVNKPGPSYRVTIHSGDWTRLGGL